MITPIAWDAESLGKNPNPMEGFGKASKRGIGNHPGDDAMAAFVLEKFAFHRVPRTNCEYPKEITESET